MRNFQCFLFIVTDYSPNFLKVILSREFHYFQIFQKPKMCHKGADMQYCKSVETLAHHIVLHRVRIFLLLVRWRFNCRLTNKVAV